MKRRLVLWLALAAGVLLLLYLGGLAGQWILWHDRGIEAMEGRYGLLSLPVPADPRVCFAAAFSRSGVKGMAAVLVAAGVILGLGLLFRRLDRETGLDPRGFRISSSGRSGTAGWMEDREARQVLDLCRVGDTKELILGRRAEDGLVYALPSDTPLNRHVAVVGASGTMKSRAVIRNALFQALRRGESVVVTDPKGELYGDTAALYRKAGYTVRVFNLADPKCSDRWNCMDDILRGDPMAAQILTGVIIGNTGSGKSDPFWDNGEANLLKALVLLVAGDPALPREHKNLGTVYQTLTGCPSLRELKAKFAKLPPGHPALAAWHLFAQSAANVQANFVTGLGSRLQVLQNPPARDLVCRSEISLSLPATQPCAYYLVLSDQDTTLSFLSSLFFTFLFQTLVRTADARPERCCPVPVNLILDEFVNIGRIGGAADGSDFTRALSTVRSRNIRILLAVQSVGQLQNKYRDGLWAEILGNCDIQVLLGTTDGEVTAKYFSERSGKMTVETASVRASGATIQPYQR